MQQRLMKGLTKMIQKTDQQVDEANELAKKQAELLDQADSWGAGSYFAVFVGIAIIAAGVYVANTQFHFLNNVPTTLPGATKTTEPASVISAIQAHVRSTGRV